MSDITDIETLVRHLVEDNLVSLVPGDIFTYTASSVFTLSEPNVSAITGLYINGTSSASYTFDSSTNKVTVSASLTAGDTVEIQYSYYPNYSVAQMESYIRSATVHLSINGYYTYEIDDTDTFHPDLNTSRKNLIAFVAAILIKPDNVSYRFPDMAINVPKAMPTRDLISKAIAIFKRDTHGVFSVGDYQTYIINC